jgi:hypothetical protein
MVWPGHTGPANGLRHPPVRHDGGRPGRRSGDSSLENSPDSTGRVHAVLGAVVVSAAAFQDRPVARPGVSRPIRVVASTSEANGRYGSRLMMIPQLLPHNARRYDWMTESVIQSYSHTLVSHRYGITSASTRESQRAIRHDGRYGSRWHDGRYRSRCATGATGRAARRAIREPMYDGCYRTCGTTGVTGRDGMTGDTGADAQRARFVRRPTACISRARKGALDRAGSRHTLT